MSAWNQFSKELRFGQRGSIPGDMAVIRWKILKTVEFLIRAQRAGPGGSFRDEGAHTFKISGQEQV